MIKKLFIIIFFVVFHANLTKADLVKDIEIIGNKRVSKETIQVYGEISNNKNYSQKDLDKVLKNLYNTNFFKDVTVEIINNKLKIIVVEHPIINQLIILGEANKRYRDQIIKIISLKQNSPFTKNNLSSDIETIKKLYSSVGYNFAKINAKTKDFDDTKVDLIFEISKGTQTKIKRISFSGDKKIREKRLRDIIASQEDKFWKIITKNTLFSENLINLDTRLLKNYYKSIGYYDVKIFSKTAELDEKNKISIDYSIDAGTRYSIDKIFTNIDSVFDKEIFFPLKDEYEKYVGKYYSPFKIKKLLDSIDELVEKNDLQFVEHNVEEIKNEDKISIKLNIFEGEKVLVERINILGNNVTNEDVIRSELEIDEGDPFTKIGLDKSVSNLKSRRLFSQVTSETKDGSEKNLKIIDVKVEEQPTGEISAGAGVGTNGGTFVINISENNWMGEGNRVGFALDVDSESLKGKVDFTNPNYDYFGNSINYSISSSQNDKPDQGYENTVLGASIATSFEQYKDINTRLGLEASYDDLQTLDSASDSLKKQKGTFSEIAANYRVTLDKRNRSFMPTSGSVVAFGQSLPIYADRGAISNTLSASFYKSITDNIIGASKIYVNAINGLNDEDVRLSKRVSLSTRRLRGFERGKIGPIDGSDHVGGNYAAAINFEANLPNFLPENTKTDVGLFLDFGNVWGVDYDETLDESNKLRSSTGINASWNSPLGPMTFVLSTNLSKASTDRTESFNFNLGTTF